MIKDEILNKILKEMLGDVPYKTELLSCVLPLLFYALFSKDFPDELRQKKIPLYHETVEKITKGKKSFHEAFGIKKTDDNEKTGYTKLDSPSSVMGRISKEFFAPWTPFRDAAITSKCLGTSPEKRDATLCEIAKKIDAYCAKAWYRKNPPIPMDSVTIFTAVCDACLLCERTSGYDFYTPDAIVSQIQKILTQIKPQVKTIYDPACGNGKLLLRFKDCQVYGRENDLAQHRRALMCRRLANVPIKNSADDPIVELKAKSSLEYGIAKPVDAIVSDLPKKDAVGIIRKSLPDRLKKGGVAVFACGAHILTGRKPSYRAFREALLTKDKLSQDCVLSKVVLLPREWSSPADEARCILVIERTEKSKKDFKQSEVEFVNVRIEPASGFNGMFGGKQEVTSRCTKRIGEIVKSDYDLSLTSQRRCADYSTLEVRNRGGVEE